MTPSPQKNKPVVALAGATGHLGAYVTEAFLSPLFRPHISSLILLSRQPTSTSPKLQEWTSVHPDLVQVRIYNDTENVTEADLQPLLKDVDVLVNMIGSKRRSYEFKEALLCAFCAASTNSSSSSSSSATKLYFPSEFGVDHTVHDFPQAEWDKKKAHTDLAAQLAASSHGIKMKVCRIFCGLFLEDSIGPWFGFDTKNGIYEVIGSSTDAKVSFTAMRDVGNAVAALVTMMSVEDVPADVHVAGDTLSLRDVAGRMEEAGAGRIEVREVDLGEFKGKVVREGTGNPGVYLRFLMGEGKIDHRSRQEGGLGDENEVVDPNEERWRWKSMKDLAVESQGRPNLE